MNQFKATGEVFGIACKNADDAMAAVTPYSTAAAILGVTAGSVLGLIYLLLRQRTIGDGLTAEMLESSPEPASGKEIRHKIIKFALPVVTSSLVLNITNLIDTWTIQNRLNAAIYKNLDLVRGMYLTEITESHICNSDIKDFLYGAYGTSLDFRNIIPTMVMTLGLSSLPVLSAAWATKDSGKMKDTIQTVLKTSMLLSVPAGFVMAALAEPILKILYIGTNAEASISISAPFVVVYGLAAFLISASTPITNMLQAIDRADVPVKSLLAGATAKIICNYILVGTPSININGAPLGTIVFYLIVIGYNLTVLLKETGIKLRIYDTFVKPFLAGAVAGGAALGFYMLFVRILPEGAQGSRLAGFTLATLLAAILSIIVWVIALLALKVLSKSNLESLPNGEKIAKVLEKRGLIR